MEITHFCNAFISVKVNNTTITCDPWVGTAIENSWVSYPVHNNGINILKKLKPNFIYISHLHCDHLDPKILSKYKNKKTKIIIKKFNDQRLKKRMFSLGFYNVIECEAWKKYKLNKDISIAIIPQMSSNTSGLPEQINYDLDTSILIQSNHSKEIFFNTVDNPLSLKDCKKVKLFIKRKFNKRIAVVCFQAGAASEYPQCFLNIDRKKEKEKVIKKRLLDLKLKLRILEPKVFFPTVGGYIVSGKYSVLNKYIAQPSYDQITELLKNENYLIFEIAGGKKIIEKHGKWLLKKDKFSKVKFHMEKIIKRYLNKKYFYFNHYKNISIKDIDYLFFKSYANYKKKLTRFPIATNWNAEFCIYKNLFINSQGKINLKDSKYLKKYSIKNRRSSKQSLRNNHSKLKCHLDFNLFYGLLKRKYIWNHPLTGSLILYERTPNKFDPNLIFSLNYLVA